MSHADFLNAYLESKGTDPVNFDAFRILQGSTAIGASTSKRLTNLMHLNVDTSWYIRYRSATNPDFGATFPQALTLNNVTAIPRNDDDFNDASNPNFPGNDHIQAIANTAAFHFGYIEQGGSSLYATLSRKVTHPEVLEVTLGIGEMRLLIFWNGLIFRATACSHPSRRLPTLFPACRFQTFSAHSIHKSSPA